MQAAIGDDPSRRRKPAPDSVLEAMRQMGVTREETVYIGDSDVDVETARNAGVACCAVSWGFRSVQCLKDAGATRHRSQRRRSCWPCWRRCEDRRMTRRWCSAWSWTRTTAPTDELDAPLVDWRRRSGVSMGGALRENLVLCGGVPARSSCARKRT